MHNNVKLKSAAITGILQIWLNKECSPQNAKQFALNTGYEDSPLFWRVKRKGKLLSELSIFNMGVMLISCHMTLNEEDIADVVTLLTTVAYEDIFSHIEKHYPQHKVNHEARMASYLEAFGTDNYPRLVSGILLKSLKIKENDRSLFYTTSLVKTKVKSCCEICELANRRM